MGPPSSYLHQGKVGYLRGEGVLSMYPQALAPLLLSPPM
jgi:hypothetical protein